MEMYDLELIRDLFKKHTDQTALSVQPFTNFTNNRVYRIETEVQPYIFKIYAGGDWPEDGKLPFVSRLLREHHIPHAELIVFSQGGSPFRYSIEECLPGTTADRLPLSAAETAELFQKLAGLVSAVHQIPMRNYGYIGHGVAGWTTFSEFVFDSFQDCTARLLARRFIGENERETVRHRLLEKLLPCDGLPPALCHGDLSLKNLLVHQGGVTLIDWDDAHSLCWPADVARLTFWMKLNYDAEQAAAYRSVFLENYKTDSDIGLFQALEDALHVWYGFDYLNFFVGKPQYEKTKGLLEESRHRCGI